MAKIDQAAHRKLGQVFRGMDSLSRLRVPLLLDHNVGIDVAVATSLRAVAALGKLEPPSPAAGYTSAASSP